MPPELASAPAETFGPWHPGIESQIPRDLLHLCTIFRPENVFGDVADAIELADLTGLPADELVAFRPERLALHEVLIRVTADLSVPDGTRIEDLGINFRQITRTLLSGHIEPHREAIDAAYGAMRGRLRARIDAEVGRLFDARTSAPPSARKSGAGGWRALLGHDRAPIDAAATGIPPERQVLADWTASAHAAVDRVDKAAYRALARVLSALLVRHGRVWGSRDLIASIAAGFACNDAGADAIGRLVDPWIAAGAKEHGYAALPRQTQPFVMNTKGPSASGKSTLRPLQKKLAADIGVDWRDFALISPDIWRKQLLDYGTLGAAFRYGGAFTADELQIVDQKLDRYMARKAELGGMTHLLIDRFRFDSFAPDSDEAGSNLLTRFGRIVYLFFMITPPASLVERAWKRGLDVGRYKAVDDTLAHAVEAYSGMPQLFFTWIERVDKRVHFEFLDNSVQLGERPRTIAFGWNDTLNVLDVGGLLDVERFRRVNIDAGGPELLYDDRALLAPERNTAFLRECVRRFGEINFALQSTGRVYARLVDQKPVWVDRGLISESGLDADTRAGLAAVAPGAVESGPPAPDRPTYLAEIAGDAPNHTLGRWGGRPQE